MAKYSPKLMRLLIIRGISRGLAPLAVLWGIYDWYTINPVHAAIFAALTLNYVIVYVLSWIAPAAMEGPWRIRPWQTFVLLINAVVLPIVFYRTHDALPWGFITITLLFLVGLYVSTMIMLYLYQEMPMSSLFAGQRGEKLAEILNKTNEPETPEAAA